MSLRDSPLRLTSWTWGEAITATVAIWVVGRSPQPIRSAELLNAA
jgi:hypothetical protein